MIYYTGTKDIQLKNTVVALGKFDGLHRGHQVLIDKLQAYEKKGYQTVVFTFDFHPMSLLTGKKQSLIYTREERKKIVEKMGIDVLIEYPFTQDTAHMLPEDFIKNVLIQCIDAKVIVVGDDFHFGYQRKGDVAVLKQYAEQYGYIVDNCEKLCIDGAEVGSTRIRQLIAEGDMQEVEKLLGRSYSILGNVIPGRANGRTVGMPTANIAPDDTKLLPPDGVYASSIHIEGEEKDYFALTNIGHNPTVGENNDLRVETFVLDFSGDLYNKQIEVKLYLHIRGEKKFANLVELKEQVERDQQKAIEYFKTIQL